MDMEDHAQEKQDTLPPHITSSSVASHSSSTSIPGAPQGTTSENGIHFPIPFPGSHVLPGGSSVMTQDNQSNLTGFSQYPQFTDRTHTQPLPNGSSHSSILPQPSQTSPFFFLSGSVVAQSALPTHGPEFQTTLGNSDQLEPACFARRASLSTLPVHPPPPQLSPGRLHTPYDSFPGQYLMPTYPPPHLTPPRQPHAYHPPGPGLYSPTRYFPLPLHEHQPYFQRQFNVQSRDPRYQQSRYHPSPNPQFATSNLGPSHAWPHGGIQQYMPHIYSSNGMTRQYQPNMVQWYYVRDPSAERFTEGDPVQAQRHLANNLPRHPRTHTLGMQSKSSESLPSPSLPMDFSSSATVVATAENTVSRAADDPREQTSLQKTDTHPLGQELAASTSITHDHTLTRRSYHPNPPPDRSQWVMWVGNVPNETTQDEFLRFLRQSAGDPASSGSECNDVEGNGVMSIFLISRSNCAFANYRSEDHLNRAITQFNGRKLRPDDHRCPRLVCRARRRDDDLRAGVGAQRGMGVHTRYVKNMLQKCRESLKAGNGATLSKGHLAGQSKIDYSSSVPPISGNVGAPKPDAVEGECHKITTRSPNSYASTSSSFLAHYFPKRFFILKSLTRCDLDLSTEHGVWATQKHNEAILDQAFRTSREVILIFSVNKSGEFYGYARMASGISRSDQSVTWASRGDSSPRAPSPSTSRTAAHDIPAQDESSSPQTPETYSPLSEPRVEVSSSSLALSSEETKDSSSVTGPSHLGFAQQRRSSLPTLHCDPGVPVCPVPLPPGFSSGPSDPPATLRSESRRHPGVREAISKAAGIDAPGPLRPTLPVVKVQAESRVREGQSAQVALLPATMHGPAGGQGKEGSWGEAFGIEWLCTQRIQFHRTRHLRNPWNHGREIKVSRDGTELEPMVGQQLIDSWSILAGEPAGGYGYGDRRTAAGPAGKRGAKPVPKFGATESRGTKEGPS